MSSTRLTRLAVILSSAAIISYSAAAHAGFEWKGPIEAPAPQPAASDAGGNMSGSMSDLAPVGSESMPAPAAAAAPAPAAAPMAAAAPAPAAAPASGDVVAGFAKDVPLVMALQQIVPPGYQYSFSSGVDAGTSVSWEGGKPWQAVLNDMLSPHGLGFSLQNNTVVVGASQGAATPVSAPASAPAPAPQQDAMMTPMPGDSAPAASQSSSAPMNIVSPPPAQMSGEAAAPAPMAQQASAAPAPAAAPAEAKKEDTVTIHREKPKSLLERLGFTRKKKDDVAQAPAPEKVAAADVPAPQPAAAPTATDAAPVATAQPAAAMTAVAPSGSWTGGKGQTLRDVLKAWSDKAGVDLYWSIDYDYRLSEDVSMSGSYDDAVGALLDKFNTVRPQPYGQLHQGGQGPRVLVIKSYDLAQ